MVRGKPSSRSDRGVDGYTFHSLLEIGFIYVYVVQHGGYRDEVGAL